jgi:hypothetical protein
MKFMRLREEMTHFSGRNDPPPHVVGVIRTRRGWAYWVLLRSTYLCLPVPFPLLKTNLGCRYSLFARRATSDAWVSSDLGSSSTGTSASICFSPDLLLQSWAAAAHLPQVLGHQWRGYVHHTLDPRFVLLRTTPTPPPLPRRRHPGAFLRHGRSTSVCGVFWKKLKFLGAFSKKQRFL